MFPCWEAVPTYQASAPTSPSEKEGGVITFLGGLPALDVRMLRNSPLMENKVALSAGRAENQVSKSVFFSIP